MTTQLPTKTPKQRTGILERTADFFTKMMARWLPDPLVIAVLLTILVLAMAIGFQGSGPLEAIDYWGNGFWDLLSFSMQMTVVLLTGYILARTPIVDALLDRLTGKISSPRVAIITVTVVALVASWLNWGFGLVMGGIVAKKMGMNVKGLHYPLAIASGYSGFLVYGTGLSGTIPLTVATEGHFMEEQMGLVPTSETIFSPIVLLITAVTFVALPLFNAMLHPKDPAKVRELDQSTLIAETKPALAPNFDADGRRNYAMTLNNSPWVGIVIGVLAMIFIARHFFLNDGQVDLNSINFLFLFLGLLLFARPARFLSAVADGVKIVSGIIIQYPFYAGIMGILVGSGLVVSFADWFGSFSTSETLPFFSFLSAGIINLLAPSGGGQWAVQGPVMIEAAQSLGASEAATSMAVAFGDQWTNMLQPFWILPVLAISGLKLRDVMGYLVLVLVLTGVIFGASILAWGFLL